MAPDIKDTVKRKSWERIFDKDDADNDWKFVQATFWELRLEQVKSVRKFTGQGKEYDIDKGSDKVKPYFVYILKCADDTLYTGITNDLENRIAAHNSGKGAKYTCGRIPAVLAYKEICNSKSDALKRESEIKKMKRKRKLKLIAESQSGTS